MFNGGFSTTHHLYGGATKEKTRLDVFSTAHSIYGATKGGTHLRQAVVPEPRLGPQRAQGGQDLPGRMVPDSGKPQWDDLCDGRSDLRHPVGGGALPLELGLGH